MTVKNIIFGFFVLIVFGIIILHKQQINILPEFDQSQKNINSSIAAKNKKTSQNKEANVATKEILEINKLRKEKKVLKPNLAKAREGIKNDPELLVAANQNLTGQIVKAVKDSVSTQAEAEKILNLIENCVSVPTSSMALEIQANCIIGAKEIVKKYPSLKSELEEKVLAKSSDEAKNLANRLALEGLKK